MVEEFGIGQPVHRKEDAAADGLGHFPVMVDVPARDGRKLQPTPRAILQTAAMRCVGDPVALVVAETRQEAQDAAELVEVEYDLLPFATDAADRDGAPLVRPEHGGNLCVHWWGSREAEADAALARAARTVRVELVNNCLVGNPIEPRAADPPSFDLGLNVVALPNNDLGVMGAGEGCVCGATPAAVSAVCDAFGVPHIDMPLTPARVWRAMAAAA